MRKIAEIPHDAKMSRERCAEDSAQIGPAGSRSPHDDQRAMLGAEEARWLADKAKREQAKAGREAGGKATPEQQAKREENRSEDDVAPKRSD
jgi:hypothetical protein